MSTSNDNDDVIGGGDDDDRKKKQDCLIVEPRESDIVRVQDTAPWDELWEETVRSEKDLFGWWKENEKLIAHLLKEKLSPFTTEEDSMTLVKAWHKTFLRLDKTKVVETARDVFVPQILAFLSKAVRDTVSDPIKTKLEEEKEAQAQALRQDAIEKRRTATAADSSSSSSSSVFPLDATTDEKEEKETDSFLAGNGQDYLDAMARASFPPNATHWSQHPLIYCSDIFERKRVTVADTLVAADTGAAVTGVQKTDQTKTTTITAHDAAPRAVATHDDGDDGDDDIVVPEAVTAALERAEKFYFGVAVSEIQRMEMDPKMAFPDHIFGLIVQPDGTHLAALLLALRCFRVSGLRVDKPSTGGIPPPKRFCSFHAWLFSLAMDTNPNLTHLNWEDGDSTTFAGNFSIVRSMLQADKLIPQHFGIGLPALFCTHNGLVPNEEMLATADMSLSGYPLYANERPHPSGMNFKQAGQKKAKAIRLVREIDLAKTEKQLHVSVFITALAGALTSPSHPSPLTATVRANAKFVRATFPVENKVAGNRTADREEDDTRVVGTGGKKSMRSGDCCLL